MNGGLTLWGWLSLAAAWGVILVLTIYCFSRVLLAKKKKESGLGDTGGRMQWGSRIGLILAMAGNAIGLGNFLRFPVKAAANGGGAFMIPYFCALLFLGVPLMWVEWSMGRHGGVHGHGTTPGMFSLMWKHPVAKYLGALGISLPFIIVVYYNFIESWTLGFAWFSGTGKYYGLTTRDAMGKFLRGFQGVEHNQFFASWLPLIVFMTITIFLNYYFLRKGISKGIEVLAKIGMPVLFIFGIILARADHGHTAFWGLFRGRGHGIYVEPRFQPAQPGHGLAGSSRPDILHPEPRAGHHQHLRLLSARKGRRHP
jgi:hypothetical protein